MDEGDLKSTVISSLFWKFLQTCGTSGVGFIISIILARLLLPEDFGIIALITVFIAISNIFIQSGFSTALIQNKDVTDIDYSSVFFVTLGIATLIYAILFITAPLVAVFYNQPIITPVLRVLGLTLFCLKNTLSAVSSPHLSPASLVSLLHILDMASGLSLPSN